MQSVLIYVAAAVAITIALIHGFLSEFKVFPAVKFEPERLRPLMRGVWQIPTVDWIAFAILLLMAPSLASPAALRAIVLVAAGVFAFASAVNFVGTRGRHFGWMILAGVVVLLLTSLFV